MLDNLAHMPPHASVVTVSIVPTEPQQSAGTGLGEMPIKVIQPGSVDPHAVELFFVQPGLWSGRQYDCVAAATLEPFGYLANNDFGTTADMGRIQTV
jgi:hypothetical protein